MNPKLIEETFPIEEISKLAIPERSSYKPIYQISKWFARRSSSMFRAIILGSVLSSNENLMDQFYLDHDFKNYLLLDPFMGGGTSIIEGLRLGINCVGVDINPIAWFITKTEAELVDINEIEGAISECMIQIKEEIKNYYRTSCPNCQGNADIIYAHWIKTVPCVKCKTNIPIFRSFIIGKILQKWFLICPKCSFIFKSKKIPSTKIECPKCFFIFNPRSGNRIGRQKVKCNHCGNIFNLLEAIKSNSTKVSSIMYAIEGFCNSCTNNKISETKLSPGLRFFKAADKDDLLRYEDAKHQWYEESSFLLWPKEKIPNGETTKVLLNHQYLHWSDLFNERQLLALSKIFGYISDINNETIQEMFLAAFISLLNHNNMFTRYSLNGQKVEGIFARHDFHPLSSFAENNVWGTKFGRGTWIKCLRRLYLGKKYNISPYSLKYEIIRGKKVARKIFSGKIDGKLEKNSKNSNLSSINNLKLFCHDSGKKIEEVALFDLIITDPPYVDNINYSELSDFFYVWIKLVLEDRYQWFKFRATPKEEEAIASRSRELDYFKKLLDIFKSVKNLMRPNGLFIFTFHHSNREFWVQLANTISLSGFGVVRTHPIPSEARNVLNIRDKKSISFDLIIVCKILGIDKCSEITYAEFINQFQELYDLRRKELEKANIKVKDLDYLAIFAGVLMELEFKYVIKSPTGESLSHDQIWEVCYKNIPKNQ